MMQRDNRRSGPRRPDGASGALSAEETADLEAVLSGDAARIDELGERIGQALAGLASAQVRNFYGPMVRLRVESDPEKRRKDARMHRPRLAYMVARNDRARELWKWFGPLLKRASDRRQFDAVCDLAEAVVAYHRFHSRESNRQEGRR